MNIIKYNQPKGKTASMGSASPSIGSDAGADYSAAIAAVGDVANQNKKDIDEIKRVIASLGSSYLKHGGDVDAGTYELGEVVSDDIRSPYYFTEGFGMRAAYLEDGYKLIVRDIGDTTVPLTTTNGENTELPTNTNVSLSVQLNNAFTITNTYQGARVLVDCGVNLPSGATIIQEQAYASFIEELRAGDNWAELYKDGQYWVVGLRTSGRPATYKIKYEAVVRYSGSLSVYAQAYIKGTNNNGTTRYYGGGQIQSIITPSEVMVTDGTNAVRITATAAQKSTDGGQTWVPY